MTNSPFRDAIWTLPTLARTELPELAAGCGDQLAPAFAATIDRVFITGCGDSHHAGVAASLAFQQFSGLQFVSAMPAMRFARYQASFLPVPDGGRSLVIGISISGEVSRTVEALELAALGGAKTLAVTANPGGSLTRAAELTLLLSPAPATDVPEGMVLPGSSSYITSLLALFQIALRLGLSRGRLTETAWLGHQR
ncbi:MAG: SIS domain-containing protein, partial [Chloroflexota bacterium]